MFQAILLGLVAMIGNAEYLFGTCLLSRPIVMGTLTGIVLGDIPTGVSLGATLELAFMGGIFNRGKHSAGNDFRNGVGNCFHNYDRCRTGNGIDSRSSGSFSCIDCQEHRNGIYSPSVCS